jgi:hypothetical protein
MREWVQEHGSMIDDVVLEETCAYLALRRPREPSLHRKAPQASLPAIYAAPTVAGK